MSFQIQDPTTLTGINSDVSDSASQHLRVWNCINCRRRKVRCNRRYPCAPCTKIKADCIFPVSGRVPRRSRDAHLKKQTELVGHLRRLEAMVGDLSSQVEQSTGINEDECGDVVPGTRSVRNTVSSERNALGGHDAPNAMIGDPSVVPEKSQSGYDIMDENTEKIAMSENVGELDIASNGDIVVGSGFWTVFCKEVEDIFEAVQGSTVISFDGDTSSATFSAPESGHHTGYYNFLLRNTAASHPHDNMYPLPSQILFLWQVYVDNIDPFIKVLHVPTMTKVIRELKGSYDSLSASMQALVMVISYAAIVSLEDNEVQLNFDSEKEHLVARYRSGTECVLEQADCFNTSDLTALQAIAIYLAVLQSTGEAKAAWFLNGILIRLAVSVNLHCETLQAANPTLLEIEMRRRLWWQICLIDSRSRSCLDSRYNLSERMFNTEMPTNVDDLDIEPTMLYSPSPPPVIDKWTDTTVLTLRCEIWKLSQQLQSINQSQPISLTARVESLSLFQQSRAEIEQTYLKHCDPTKSLHTFTVTSSNLFLAKVDLILQSTPQPSETANPLSTPPLDKSFHASVSIIILTHALQHSADWAPYRWQLSNNRNPPWHALHLVLTRLCTALSWTSTCEDAWSAVRTSIDSCSEYDIRQHPQYQVITSLVDTVEKRRAHGINHHISAVESDVVDMDVSNATATASRTDQNANLRVEEGAYGSVFTSAIRESSREDPTLSMDWGAWNWDGEDLNSPFDFWDLNGF